MQDQLPLRHSEFVKVRDGFVAFLKKPAGTAFDAIIPPDVADKMKEAARAGARRQSYLAIARGVSVGWCLLAVEVAFAPDHHVQGIAALMTGGVAFLLSNNQAKRRTEPEIEDLTEDSEVAANLRSLDAYKARIAQGEIPGQERLPDGTTRALSQEVRKPQSADFIMDVGKSGKLALRIDLREYGFRSLPLWEMSDCAHRRRVMPLHMAA